MTREGWGLLLVKLLCVDLPDLPDLLNDNDLEKGTNNDSTK